jgi:hypothetical protein
VDRVPPRRLGAFDPASDRPLTERAAIASRALALFALFGLAFFSTSSGKRGVYVMEAFPAISLLIAAAVVSAGLGTIGFVLMIAFGLAVSLGAPLAIATGALAVPPAIAAAAGTLGAAALVLGGLALAGGAAAGWHRCAAAERVRPGPCGERDDRGHAARRYRRGLTWSRVQGARAFCTIMDAAVPEASASPSRWRSTSR